jgi:hypothetical protein
MNTENVIDTLAQSKLYHEYEKAFTDATGLPITLRGLDAWKLPHHGQRNENRFCAIMAQKKSILRCLPESAAEAGGNRRH